MSRSIPFEMPCLVNIYQFQGTITLALGIGPIVILNQILNISGARERSFIAKDFNSLTHRLIEVVDRAICIESGKALLLKIVEIPLWTCDFLLGIFGNSLQYSVEALC